MKKFLGRSSKKEDKKTWGSAGNAGDVSPKAVSASKNSTELEPIVSYTATVESQESIVELHPMFNAEQTASSSKDINRDASSQTFTNDPNLNLNPIILNPTTTTPSSMFTKDSEILGKSLFSRSGKSSSTNQSSYFSRGSDKKQLSQQRQQQQQYEGQPLKVMDILEESREERPATDVIGDKLHRLYEDVSYIMNQYSNSLVHLTTSVINTIDCFKVFVQFVKDTYPLTGIEDFWYFDTYNNVYLRKLMKIYLNLHDNILRDEVYIKLKLLLLKNFNDFALSLDSQNRGKSGLTSGRNDIDISKPQNYSIGINTGKALPNQDVLTNIINKITNTNLSVKEQNGSFIAPITRGISKQLNILCLYFGHPNPTDYHMHLIQRLHDLYDDIHFISIRNQIDMASAKTQILPQQHQQQHSSVDAGLLKEQPPRYKFKLPFRLPTDFAKPPMSLSLSVENSLRTSGTLGGFIYPMIDLKKQPEFASYSSYSYAITCGHVCLNNNNEENTAYSNVAVPLSVLISLYKQALLSQYAKFDHTNAQGNVTSGVESKVAYGTVLKQLDEIFPMKRIKTPSKQLTEVRNLPIHRFGQIIWGERTLLKMDSNGNSDDEFVEKRLSDLAIVKVNKALRCELNFLGDDIAFNEFDPALMFDNLYVRAILDLNRNINTIDIDDVDSTLSGNNLNNHGLPVFKYGSTTKFTKGTLNGIKLVYWLDGTIHSSEFVVNSLENNSAFAAGGDSGAWILAKLEDCETNRESKGLGVVGMLHSYDGEYKQFGLYTPMCEILERLEQVTNIKWGVVGVPEKDTDILSAESDIESKSTVGDDYDDDDEDDDDENSLQGLDGALPPDID